MEKTTTHSNSLSSEASPDKDQELPHLRHKVKKKKSKHPLVVNLLDCKYMVVRQVTKGLKFSITRDSQVEWDLTWTDGPVTPETLSRMKPYQKINHFPAMFNLSRKNYLARNLNKMQKEFPQHYDFYPKTWTLPAQHNELRQFLENETNPVVIAKPEASCQGRGIFLTKNIEDFCFGEHYVVQKYLKKPFLIEGLKFDLRVYVLVAGCDPLRVYIYKQGLARFATEAYSAPKKQNLSNLFMHLTNYAINKVSHKFEFNNSPDRMDIGHKRSLSSILLKLKELGHDSESIWQDICLIITKTLISVQPVLAHTYRSCQPDNLANNMCFELLGFDVMLDSQLKPVILEVNYTPSFSTDTPLDALIKENLIRDALILMNLTNRTKQDALAVKKREMMERTLTGKKVWRGREEREIEMKRISEKRDRWEEKHIGNFQKIYPFQEEQNNKEIIDQLLRFMAHSESCYLSGTGANIKRNTKLTIPSSTTSDLSESQIPKTAQTKFTRTDQLERIYMKKTKQMNVKGHNRSQIREEKGREGEEKGRSSVYGKGGEPEFVRNKGYESVQKMGGGLKYEASRVDTLQKVRARQEQEEKQPSKKGNSALARVYNVAFREMRPLR